MFKLFMVNTNEYTDLSSILTLGLFLLVTIAFLKGHSVARYVRSLVPLTPLTRSTSLRFATLASLARSVHRLTHSLRSLPRGTVEIHEYVFTLKSRYKTQKLSLLETRPYSRYDASSRKVAANDISDRFNLS